MQIEFQGDRIIVNKELSVLDTFTLDFANILAKHQIKYVIVLGYIATLFGRDRMNEDVDILTRSMTFEKFLKLWLELEKAYDCLSTGDPIDAYNAYLRNHHAIRIAKKGNSIPNIHIRFVKNEIERSLLKYRKQVKLGDRNLFISPLEIQIPYKLSMGSEKDIEDARFLFGLFRGRLNKELLDKFLTELNIPKESTDTYLGKSKT